MIWASPFQNVVPRGIWLNKIDFTVDVWEWMNNFKDLIRLFEAAFADFAASNAGVNLECSFVSNQNMHHLDKK